MPHKVFDNNIVEIQKIKVSLKPNRPEYMGMCILELSKVSMYKFHYDCIKNKSDSKSKLLFIDTDSSMYEIKTKDVYEDFSSNEEIFDFSNYLTKSKSKYYDGLSKLVIGKMKNETGGVAIEEFVGLKPKLYLFLVDDNSEHREANGVNRNVVATTSHNEYKDVLLNNNCLRHSMNRTQSKDNKIGTYEINKVSLSCFDDKIYIQNKGYDGLALGYQSYLEKTVTLITILKKLFCQAYCFKLQSN